MNRARLSVLAALIVFVCSGLVLAGGPKQYPRRGSQGYNTKGMFRLQVGLFTPEGDSKFWKDEEIDFFGDAEGLEDSSFLVEFEWSVTRETSVVFGGGRFEGAQWRAYRDYVDGDGFDIEHRSKLRVSPLTAGVRFYPLGRDNGINVYLGAGGGFYWWRYSEVGDFIDFQNEGEIFFGAFESDGIATGYYLNAGIDFKISPTMSLYADARKTAVDDELDDQFEGFGEIDLSGTELSLGLAWRF